MVSFEGLQVRVRRGAAVCLLAVSACAWNAPRDEAVSYRMGGHYRDAGIVQRAVVLGDLERARTAAARIAAMTEVPGVEDARAGWVPRIADAAGDLEGADGYAEAAVATGRLAATCGACHEATRRGPRFERVSDPPARAGFDGHMVRHVWAADRMFEALVASSDALWAAGADVFAEDPLEGGAVSAEVAPHARELHRLGLEALHLDDRQDRARQYGRMLAECSACHMEMGIVP
jgi:cytochrome c553